MPHLTPTERENHFYNIIRIFISSSAPAYRLAPQEVDDLTQEASVEFTHYRVRTDANAKAVAKNHLKRFASRRSRSHLELRTENGACEGVDVQRETQHLSEAVTAPPLRENDHWHDSALEKAQRAVNNLQARYKANNKKIPLRNLEWWISYEVKNNSQRHIAEVSGKPASLVKTGINRARKEIREEILRMETTSHIGPVLDDLRKEFWDCAEAVNQQDFARLRSSISRLPDNLLLTERGHTYQGLLYLSDGEFKRAHDEFCKALYLAESSYRITVAQNNIAEALHAMELKALENGYLEEADEYQRKWKHHLFIAHKFTSHSLTPILNAFRWLGPRGRQLEHQCWADRFVDAIKKADEDDRKNAIKDLRNDQALAWVVQKESTRKLHRFILAAAALFSVLQPLKATPQSNPLAEIVPHQSSRLSWAEFKIHSPPKQNVHVSNEVSKYFAAGMQLIADRPIETVLVSSLYESQNGTDWRDLQLHDAGMQFA
ncbi:MAG: hypothetical protein AAFV53_10525 [Myxococcota bacterium]